MRVRDFCTSGRSFRPSERKFVPSTVWENPLTSCPGNKPVETPYVLVSNNTPGSISLHLVAKEPFLSYFQLHNKERLTLGDLIKSRLSNAELAFLSACHSAAIDIINTPDEAIHLAAALQFCGFRSVVGTLWAMADVDGPDVAEDCYWYMFHKTGVAGDFRGSAAALNYATQKMRIRGVVDRLINFCSYWRMTVLALFLHTCVRCNYKRNVSEFDTV